MKQEEKVEDLKLTDQEQELLTRATKLYENGEYAEAVKLFRDLRDRNHELIEGLKYYIRFCENVLNTKLSGDDQIYLVSKKVMKAANWLWIPGVYLALPLLNLFSEDGFSAFSLTDGVRIVIAGILFYSLYQFHNVFPYGYSGNKIRCKHCGHYTRYIPPNEGVAYMGSNNCNVCSRGYPAPSSMWDNNWGQSYIYERGSVTEPVFYAQFEKDNPEYPKGEIADGYLGRNKKKHKKEHKTK